MRIKSPVVLFCYRRLLQVFAVHLDRQSECPLRLAVPSCPGEFRISFTREHQSDEDFSLVRWIRAAPPAVYSSISFTNRVVQHWPSFKLLILACWAVSANISPWSCNVNHRCSQCIRLYFSILTFILFKWEILRSDTIFWIAWRFFCCAL